jgi:hypothetical protein
MKTHFALICSLALALAASGAQEEKKRKSQRGKSSRRQHRLLSRVLGPKRSGRVSKVMFHSILRHPKERLAFGYRRTGAEFLRAVFVPKNITVAPPFYFSVILPSWETILDSQCSLMNKWAKANV